MPKVEQSPESGEAAGGLSPRPRHGHRSPETESAGADLEARQAADPHPSWLKTWRRLRARLVGSRPAGPAQEPVRELQDKIAHTPAGTLAGLQAQAELISELAWNDVVAATARQLVAGLKRQQRPGAR